jgi:hypothetical protein
MKANTVPHEKSIQKKAGKKRCAMLHGTELTALILKKPPSLPLRKGVWGIQLPAGLRWRPSVFANHADSRMYRLPREALLQLIQICFMTGHGCNVAASTNNLPLFQEF